MGDALAAIPGQPTVRSYLRSACESGRISHSHLFVGASGSCKKMAARALAQAIVCSRGGCGDCDDCRRAAAGTHPDIHELAPRGVKEYLVDQIRELSRDVNLAPVRGSAKVYIITHAERLSAYCANAFLKTLEEPPEKTFFILIAQTRESVLPTIASRCQTIPFRAIPRSESRSIVAEGAGVSERRAGDALEACGGSIERALAFAASDERMAFRRTVIEAISSLFEGDGWGALKAARAVHTGASAFQDDKTDARKEERARTSDFLSPTLAKAAEKEAKRTLAAQGREALAQATSIIRSLLRDALAMSMGAGELVTNEGDAALVERIAKCAQETEIVTGIRATAECDAMIAYNVGTRIALEVLFLKLHDICTYDGRQKRDSHIDSAHRA